MFLVLDLKFVNQFDFYRPLFQIIVINICHAAYSAVHNSCRSKHGEKAKKHKTPTAEMLVRMLPIQRHEKFFLNKL